ncbi:MAG: hypothetical protein ACKOWD_11345 [Rhodoferax sp.]
MFITTGNFSSMRTLTLTRLALAAALSLGAATAFAQTEVTAVLAGHAALPASTTVAAPKSAGKFFATSGKFAGANRQRT